MDDWNHQTMDDSDNVDQLNITSHLGQSGSTFIMLAILNSEYHILIIKMVDEVEGRSFIPQLIPIRRIEDHIIIYLTINGDRTVTIGQLDGIRRGYLNCDPNDSLTCDRAAGSTFRLNELESFESTDIKGIKLSGMSYSLEYTGYRSSDQSTSILIGEDRIPLNDLIWLVIPINIKPVKPIQTSKIEMSLSTSQPSISRPSSSIATKIKSAHNRIRDYYKQLLQLWLIMIASIIIIVSIYLLNHINNLKLSVTKSID